VLLSDRAELADTKSLSFRSDTDVRLQLSPLKWIQVSLERHGA